MFIAVFLAITLATFLGIILLHLLIGCALEILHFISLGLIAVLRLLIDGLMWILRWAWWRLIRRRAPLFLPVNDNRG